LTQGLNLDPSTGKEKPFLENEKEVDLEKQNKLPKMIRIKQLSEETGVPKGTIQYYVKEGLIPRPIKTSANMGYYTQEHINAIRIVKELQSKRFLPLSIIKQMISWEDGGMSMDEIKTLVEMDGQLFKNMKEILPTKDLTAKQLIDKTGISQEDIDDLEELGLLSPTRKGKRVYYNEDDIRFLECGIKLRELGFSDDLGFDMKVFKLHKEMIENLVAEEAKYLLDRLAGKEETENIIRLIEQATPLINTMMGLIHKRLISDAFRDLVKTLKESELENEEAKA
jgi:DNA-binding transcriptional MerR regulator